MYIVNILIKLRRLTNASYNFSFLIKDIYAGAFESNVKFNIIILNIFY